MAKKEGETPTNGLSAYEQKKSFKGILFPLEDPPHLIGREAEVEFLRESLHKKRMKNSVLVGEAGVGKTVIVEELVKRMAKEARFLSFSPAVIISGTQYRGTFEKKLLEILNIVVSYNRSHPAMPLYLFIDEIHLIYRAGACEGDEMDIGNILKPFLANGTLTVIGATTPEEYQETIAKDPALSRRLSPIYVSELTQEAVIPILKEFAEGQISDALIEEIYRKSLTLQGSNPDKSLEIIDRALAKKACTGRAIDAGMIKEIIAYLSLSFMPEGEERHSSKHCSL